MRGAPDNPEEMMLSNNSVNTCTLVYKHGRLSREGVTDDISRNAMKPV